MVKKSFFLTLSLMLLAQYSSAAEKENSLVLLNTNKTIEETKPKSKAKLEPVYDITNVLNSEPAESTDGKIYFSANEMQNDDNTNVVSAIGNVEIIRQNLKLTADRVDFNRDTSNVTANGNVVITEVNGNVIYADHVNLTEKLQNADVQNIKVILLDKTRLNAKSFHKKANNKKILHKVSYSPCDLCEGGSPLWQIKAGKVLHDAGNQNIEYQNAFLEIKDIPVFYTPFFSHPDPSVKHRSGFLFPRFLSNKYLGASVQPQYFWDISSQENIIFNPIISSDKNPVYSAIFNKYFYNGELNASGTFMKDKDSTTQPNRGNLFLFGRYEINDYWVADTDINYVSDYKYLKDLNLPKKDDSWLTSRVRFQRFDDRDYALIEGYYYDMLSYDLQHTNKPTVLPFMTYETISAPNSIGGYFKTTLNSAFVRHKKNDNSYRASMINSWNLPYTSPFGEKYRLTASIKSDLYYVSQYQYINQSSYTGITGRIFPQAGLEWRLPFIKNTTTTSQILEPIVVAAVSPNQDNKPEKIPNFDSRDVELTDVNIFDLDRYSGYDRNDTGSRISYGLNWSFYGKQWGRSSALLAQAYEFKKDENPLNSVNKKSHFSDYVGRLYSAPNEFFDINFRFKLDKNDYDLNYSELTTGIGNNVLRFYTSYIYFQDDETIENSQNSRRKEIYLALNSQVTRNWSVNAFTRYDMIRKNTTSHGGGIAYEDECSRFAFSTEKEYSDDPDAENDFTFYFTFYLKTLGGIGNQ
ncbi:MAG: LPS assembly protein LptD [Alphaproteobacteria bacterium]|nr:LPS assembly protein LptD [Alphaproteobacteria bacterium]